MKQEKLRRNGLKQKERMNEREKKELEMKEGRKIKKIKE